MSGKKIGYIRVSSFDQNPERQLAGLWFRNLRSEAKLAFKAIFYLDLLKKNYREHSKV